jgi:hypothetical protein
VKINIYDPESAMQGNTYSQKIWSLFAHVVCARLAYKLYKTSIYNLEYVFECNGMPTAAEAI